MKNWTQIVLLICMVMMIQSCKKYTIQKNVSNNAYIGNWYRPTSFDYYVKLEIRANGKCTKTTYEEDIIIVSGVVDIQEELISFEWRRFNTPNVIVHYSIEETPTVTSDTVDIDNDLVLDYPSKKMTISSRKGSSVTWYKK